MLVRRFLFSRSPKLNLASSKAEHGSGPERSWVAGQEVVARSEDKPPLLCVRLMLSCFLREG